MKKLTVIKLFIGLLFTIFASCSRGLNQKIVFRSGMPYYTSLNNEHPVDSIRLTVVENTPMEVVYYSDGRVIPYYDYLNIRNLALRELYIDYYKLNGKLIIRLSKYYDINEVNYILFNGFLNSLNMPALRKTEFNRFILSQLANHRAPPDIGVVSLVGLIIGFIIFLLFMGRYLDKVFNLVNNKPDHVNDS